MKSGLASLQGVLFVNNLDLSDKLYVAQLLQKLKSLSFDKNPTILPLPPDAPLEVPRIILKSEGGLFNVNISPTRIDLFYNNKGFDGDGIPESSLGDVEKTIVSAMKEISTIISSKLTARTSRLAVVANYLIKLDESSKKFLLKNFIKEGAVKDVNEMQLNFLMKKEVGKYKFNEWLRFNSMRSQKNLKDDSAILLTIDLNSIVEIDYNFTNESIEEFLKICHSHINGEMKLYMAEISKNG